MLDDSDLSSGITELSDAPLTHGIPASDPVNWFTPPSRITPNGKWMSITRNAHAYVVPITYGSGMPTFREPDAGDLVPISVPEGCESTVEIAATSHDGAFVAVLLTRIERRIVKHGSYAGARRGQVRHLFVARSDGTDLTQIDVGTDGVNLEYGIGNDSFIGVGFRPYTP